MELYKLAMKELETPLPPLPEIEQCLTPSGRHEFSRDNLGPHTCQKCGLIDEESTYFTPDFRYRERCTETRREYSYTRDKYFESMLNIFLCYKSPPGRIKAFAGTLPKGITKLQVREEIRSQKKTGFSRYIRAIHLLTTGGKPKHIHCTGIHKSFYVQDSLLAEQCYNRKNSINVWYKMYKLFQHLGGGDGVTLVDVLDFPLPSKRKLEEYETIMKGVWEKLHWEWVPLPPLFPPVE